MIRKLEEETEKIIEPIREKVAANQGGVVLVYRDFITGRDEGGCFGGETTYYSNHIQAGIITGSLSERTGPEKFGHIQVLSSMSWDFPMNFAVPAKRIVSAQSGGEIPRFQLRDQHLASAHEGEIPFGLFDFYCQGESSGSSLLGSLDIPSFYPRLKQFEVCIGDEGIMRFARKFGEDRINLEKVKEFIDLMKNENEFSRRVAYHRDNQTEEIKGYLVKQVASLCLLEDSLIDVESLFDRISRAGYRGNHEGLTERYRKLKSEVNQVLSNADKSLSESDGFEGQVNGRIVGFPTAIDFRDYHHHVRREVLPRVRGRLTKLERLLAPKM
jgi:hypothetical protein